MFWQWFFGILAGVAVVAAAVFFSYRHGFKAGHGRGADDFLAMILAGGYEMKVQAFRRLNAHAIPGGIAFVGDSITQDFPVGEYFAGKTVYNRGIGGDTSAGLLRRLDESVFALVPKQVVLLIGTNDLALLATTPGEIAARIQEAIGKIKAKLPKVGILLLGILPVNALISPQTVNPRKNEDIRTVNALLASTSDVIFIDLFDEMADAAGNLKPELTIEGLHINQAGYELISARLRDHIG